MAKNTRDKSSKNLRKELLDVALELSQQADQQIWWPFVGSSMTPHISEGDMLLVRHSLHPIRLGDIIVFKAAGGLVAHRVVFIRRHDSENIYRTKGDNSCSFDAPVRQSSVLGRVVRIQKDNKSISLETSHIKFLNFLSALYSYLIGILYQAVRLKSLFTRKET